MQRAATSIELGPYQLGERIGEGGSGQVYRARGPTGTVAVKVLGPASDMDDSARARFAREIAALGQLAHPNLVTLLDHGVDEELGPYLVLPLLAGSNLRALRGDTCLCPEAAILWIQPLARATAALHAAGYVHRDLKPENAIAAPDGTITLIDLGLAWRDGMTRHTDTGTAVGSVGYMAPEQIEGGAVDDRCDVWALGVMLYELVAGRRPFARARAAEEAAAVLAGSCARLDAADRRCDARTGDLVARCLAADPAKRPAIGEVVAALDALVDWTAPETVDAERAAAVADPAGYQARVSAFRVRRVERLATEALAAGKPFAALAHCDRGLAYVPDHPGLLAIVTQAEGATAPAPEPVAVTPVSAVQPASPRRRRAPWIALAVAGVAAGSLVTYLATRSPAKQAAPDPWASGPRPPPTAEEIQHDRELEKSRERDRAMMGDAMHLFGSALDRIDGKTTQKPAPAREPSNWGEPTTLKGWLDQGALQKPREAVYSYRHALILDPTSIEAKRGLCVAYASLKDPEAMRLCDEAIAAGPDAGVLISRAALRTTAGDADGAKADLQAACKLGDPQACAAAKP